MSREGIRKPLPARDTRPLLRSNAIILDMHTTEQAPATA
jgi:hypothetical protein